MAAEEMPPRLQEELCLLPAALLVAERRSNLMNRQHSFKFRKCVTNICEAAPVHFKSFIRKRAPSKIVKFAELTNSQRLARSATTRSVDSNVYDIASLKRRSKLLYYV